MKRILFLMLMLLPVCLFAQTNTLTGKVVDASGAPIPGVNIIVQDTQKGTITDTDGNFSIEVNEGQTLVFSFIGMEQQEIVYTGQSSLDVTMYESLRSLDEVVVIGYQTVKKADLTGAVSVFKPEQMKNTVVTGSVGDVLGTVPGVFSRTEGKPGAEGWIEIRGTKSFGSSKPLYVIDGIAVEGGANRDFNFNDIESVQVLKDASAAAIYGSRAKKRGDYHNHQERSGRPDED